MEHSAVSVSFDLWRLEANCLSTDWTPPSFTFWGAYAKLTRLGYKAYSFEKIKIPTRLAESYFFFLMTFYYYIVIILSKFIWKATFCRRLIVLKMNKKNSIIYMAKDLGMRLSMLI